MSFSYLTSTASTSEEGDIQDIWGYKFRWTNLHLTEAQLKPTRYTYDTLGEEVLDRIRMQQQNLKPASNGVPAGQAAGHKEDLYESLKTIASSKEDEVLTKFWEDMHTVPEWVDWEQIKRGQEVRKLHFKPPSQTDLSRSGFLSIWRICVDRPHLLQSLGRDGEYTLRPRLEECSD
jgi:hypothetical protein